MLELLPLLGVPLEVLSLDEPDEPGVAGAGAPEEPPLGAAPAEPLGAAVPDDSPVVLPPDMPLLAADPLEVEPLVPLCPLLAAP